MKCSAQNVRLSCALMQMLRVFHVNGFETQQQQVPIKAQGIFTGTKMVADSVDVSMALPASGLPQNCSSSAKWLSHTVHQAPCTRYLENVTAALNMMSWPIFGAS